MSKKRKRYQEYVALMAQLKESGCTNCGKICKSRYLHFHHCDAQETGRAFRISNFGDDYSITLKALFAELEKCVLLCNKCHRAAHYHNKKRLEEFANSAKSG